jgi:hypothetical protein
MAEQLSKSIKPANLEGKIYFYPYREFSGLSM